MKIKLLRIFQSIGGNKKMNENNSRAKEIYNVQGMAESARYVEYKHL
jgi:hypothetical protein